MLCQKKFGRLSEINKDKRNTFRDSPPLFSTVHKWVTECRHNCESLKVHPVQRMTKNCLNGGNHRKRLLSGYAGSSIKSLQNC